ncbi:MAG: hypothetical protein IKU54_07085 [Oscillospiraceae bacterium]|nr:hypothetical protein [Oscillospiraceae bacterium]
MTILFKILSVIGILLLLLIVLLLWLILVPRHFWVEYSARDGFIAQVNIAWFKFTLYPIPSFLQKKTDGKKEETVRTEKEKTTGPLNDIQFSMDLVKQVVSSAKGIMRRVFRAIKFRDVSFTVPVNGTDIHSTQKLYGAVTNAFYALSVFLQKHMQIYFKSPVFVADFAGRYSDAIYFYSKITASPVLLLVAVYYAYTQYVLITNNYKKADNAPQKEI